MLRKMILFFVLVMVVLSTSSCGLIALSTSTPTPIPTETPIPTLTPVPTPTSPPIPLLAPLDPYSKVNACEPVMTEARGEITFQSWMAGGFTANLHVTGLSPNQSYFFTINGLDGQTGNAELKQQCPLSAGEIEGYCQIAIGSNEQGEINAPIGMVLPRGQYIIKFFIKDREKFCMWMYNDFPPGFEIK